MRGVQEATLDDNVDGVDGPCNKTTDIKRPTTGYAAEDVEALEKYGGGEETHFSRFALTRKPSLLSN